MIDAAPPSASADSLESRLEHAEVGPLLAVLVHLTGDESWLEAPYRPRHDLRLFPDPSGGLAPDALHRVRAAACEALSRLDAGTGTIIEPSPDDRLLTKMMSVCVGSDFDDRYLDIAREELGLAERTPKWHWDSRQLSPPQIAIIGGGVSGICAAAQLGAAGLPYVMFEKNEDVGGTWWDNRYPDCGVDTPSHLYSYSFEVGHRWPHYFSKQPDVQRYLRSCAQRHSVVDNTRFGVEVSRAEWKDSAKKWTLELRTLDETSERADFDIVIFAVGQLNRPKLPVIDGLDTFKGSIFHSARWKTDVPLHGRVAVIGTGASAMQFLPTVAATAAHLTVFQRSPNWIVPTPNYTREVPDEAQWLLDEVPFYRAWNRLGLFWRFGDRLHEALQVDPTWSSPDRSLNATNDRHRIFLERYMRSALEGREELLRKTLPSYPPYGKRMLIDNGWFDALQRDNVSLVTEPIDRIGSDTITTCDGEAHKADVIIFATGFQSTKLLGDVEVVGREEVGLSEVWGEEDARAYLGITVPQFPNLFMLFGPNTALGHGGSIIFHTECQVRYIMSCLREMSAGGARTIECKSEPFEIYNERVDRALEQMVWSHPGVTSWYKNSAGRVVTNSPWSLVDYWKLTREMDHDDFVLR